MLSQFGFEMRTIWVSQQEKTISEKQPKILILFNVAPLLIKKIESKITKKCESVLNLMSTPEIYAVEEEHVNRRCSLSFSAHSFIPYL